TTDHPEFNDKEQDTMESRLCLNLLIFNTVTLRALREESISAVYLMRVQNLSGNEKFMGQQ
ncbi:MAG: hypothetical protein ACN4GR_11320, partial [Arenicellales bacterium]